MPPKAKPEKVEKQTKVIEDELKIQENETPESILIAGILPMFITSSTLKIFNIVIGESVTKENPKMMISREDLLLDIRTRLSISDFQPAKTQITVNP